MKTLFLKLTKKLLLAALPLLAGVSQLCAQGTAFSYEGRLSDEGLPANGNHDLRFTVFDALTGGTAVGGVVSVDDVAVSDGRFVVTLDFGGDVFTGPSRWLEIAVRLGASTGGFTTLTPRQAITPTPYAIYAGSAGTMNAADLTGTLADAQLPANVARLDASQTFTGPISFDANVGLNNHDIWLRGLGDGNHGLGWYGGGKPFGGSTPDGPVLFGWAGGVLGTIEGGPRPALAWNLLGGIFIDPANANDGAVTAGKALLFGAFGSGEGIASKRTEGGNRWGLDFYTSYAQRMTIANDGNVGIGTTTPSARLDVNGTVRATTFVGDGSGLTGLTGGGAVWNLNGNAGTTPQVSFLGTTDDVPLELKVNGQRALRLEPTTNSINVIGGSAFNFVGPGTEGATIAGGGGVGVVIRFSLGNSVSGRLGTVSGGEGNTVHLNAEAATIGGGLGNQIQTNAGLATIGGGFGNWIGNWIQSESEGATISGGSRNQTASPYATIGGGSHNLIRTDASYATIGGGRENQIWTNASFATIGGGHYNRIEAGSTNGTISGGRSNSMVISLLTNVPQSSAIGGGELNVINGADWAIVPGGFANVAGGDYSFAAGRRAKANHTGSFVWADSTDADFASTVANQFRVRARGGAIFASNAGGTTGVELAPGSGSWTSLSDRNAKTNFVPVNGVTVLEKLAALPLQTWNYRSQEASIRHIGPTAQDFKAAFGLGESDTGISTVDADGVALAAIQGLNQKLAEKDARIATLEERLAALEKLVSQVVGK